MRLKLTHEEISFGKWDEESVRMSYAARVVSDGNIHKFTLGQRWIKERKVYRPVSRS